MPEPRSVVLLYHRVHDSSHDPQRLCVSREHFAQHLEILRRRTRVVPLPELLASQPIRSPSGQAHAAVTFDDGYADNLEAVLPVLARFDCPATVCVCRAVHQQSEPFWWDEVDALILRGQLNQPDVPLRIDGRRIIWRVTAVGTTCRPPKTDNTSSSQTCEGPVTALYDWMCGIVRMAPLAGRRMFLAQLRVAFTPGAGADEGCRRLSSEELVALHESGLVELGSHTQTHPVLAALSPAAQYEEIAGSKQAIEKVIGAPVSSFAYPFGTRHDYSAATVTEVRRAGFDRACANFTGRVTAATDRFQIPRFIVRDWDGDTFERRLDAWLAA